MHEGRGIQDTMTLSVLHISDLHRDPANPIGKAVLHQSPDKRGVPLPVKMVSQLTQTWHSQVRSFC